MNNLLLHLPLIILGLGMVTALIHSAFKLKTSVGCFSFFFLGAGFCLSLAGIYQGYSDLAKISQTSLLGLGLLNLFFLKDSDTRLWDIVCLKLLILIAGYVLLGTSNVLTWYLALEIIALSSYALVAADLKSSLSAEASVKYLLQGTVASVAILFAITIVYGFTGSLDFNSWTDLQIKGELKPYLNLAIILSFSGLALKVGLVPFHFWVADVYQGARANISNFLASVGKFIAAIAFFKFIAALYSQNPELIQKLVWLVVILSVVVASAQVLTQKNLKRFFAYSAIVQSAYFTIAFLNPTEGSFQVAFLAYLLLYAISSTIIFGVISCLSTEQKAEQKADQEFALEDLAGLAGKSTLLGLSVSVALLALLGLPPVLVTLIAKINLIQVALLSDYLSLALALVFGTVVGIYYYLKLLGIVWQEGEGLEPKVAAPAKLSLVLLVILIAYYTISPSRLFDYLLSIAS